MNDLQSETNTKVTRGLHTCTPAIENHARVSLLAFARALTGVETLPTSMRLPAGLLSINSSQLTYIYF